MKMYLVNDIFVSLHGEGFHSGRKAVFVRFSGCNLWSGHEVDRLTAAGSCGRWCDTNFVGGDRLSAPDIASRAAELWGPDRRYRWVVLTGGEPTLQADAVLIDTFKRFGFSVAIETNGTRALPPGLDWVTVSPKAGVPLYLTAADEVKVVWPQDGLDLDALVRFSATHRYIQPRDGLERDINIKISSDYCMNHPRWRLSLQIHKVIGLP